MAPLVGEGFSMIRDMFKKSGLKLFSERLGNTTYTLARNNNKNVVFQRAKQITRNADGSVKIRTATTQASAKDPVEFIDNNVTYTDYVVEKVKYPNGDIWTQYFRSKEPFKLPDTKNLNHEMNVVKTGEIKIVNGNIETGIPDGFAHMV